ncbi:MAG: DNA repair protein RecN [Pseudomonadales bacterium]
MLTQLTISNYTTVENLELDFRQGMTVITGETGAGKSVMLDCLALVVGGRADSKAVRNGANRADVHAMFDISKEPSAARWLKDRDLHDGDECLLRRVITSEGRSRAYINGQPVPVQDLKCLGSLLIDIHGQHEQQSLLKKDTHRQLLDSFANATKLSGEVASAYHGWQQAERKMTLLRSGVNEQHAHAQLLEYQLNELRDLQFQPGELGNLEQQQKRLSNGESILQDCNQSLALCETDEQNNLLSVCSQVQQLLAPHAEHCQGLGESLDLLASARIQIQEAAYNIQAQVDDLELDPEELQKVEQRLSSLYQIARKHRVNADELCELQERLQAECDSLQRSDEHLEELQAEADLQCHRYLKLAVELSQQRTPAARKLQTLVNQQLKRLNMSGCKFEVSLKPLSDEQRGGFGKESIEFLISTIPGQAAQPLAKVASGGELSRISLAIQVITASKSCIPTLVFDEVDVGIGGTVADVVGNLLRALSEHSQILCVTHLAQVAAKGHQHLGVRKLSNRKKVATELSVLMNDDKVNEIARMLGGMAITEQSRAHAKEMLGTTH